MKCPYTRAGMDVNKDEARECFECRRCGEQFHTLTEIHDMCPDQDSETDDE